MYVLFDINIYMWVYVFFKINKFNNYIGKQMKSDIII